MKVLTFLSLEQKGGRMRRFVELVDGLSARGSEVVLLSPSSHQGSGSVLTEHITLPVGRFRTAKMRLSRRCLEQITMAVSHHKPEGVFTFGLANGGPLCRVARSLGVPSVLFIRGVELVLDNKSLLSFRLPVAREVVRAAYRWLFRTYARGVLMNADAVVFQHEVQYRAYAEEGLIDSAFPGRIFFLPNNSNPSWMSDAMPYQPQREPVTVIAARLEWNKGFRQAFDAFREVRARLPGARLVVLGDGPDGGAIRRYAGDIGGIEFAGYVDDVQERMRSARLLVHPSIHELGSPNVILEAAALGMPMVASDQATHTVGERSYLYPARDHQTLSALWLRALTDDSFHAWLCLESRTLADRYRFDWVGKAMEILKVVGGVKPSISSGPAEGLPSHREGKADNPGILFKRQTGGKR